MSATAPFSVDAFARLRAQTDALSLLAKELAQPTSQLYVNSVLFRTISAVRKGKHRWASILADPRFATAPLEARKKYTEALAQTVKGNQSNMAVIKAAGDRGLIFHALVAWLERILAEYDDLLETFALGADSEMDRLVKELNDVL